MHRLRFALLLSLSLPLLGLQARAEKPEPASTILKAAVGEAAASQKHVFLIFHASWCKWCKKLEGVLEAPDVKGLIGQSYVVTMLDVLERGDKKEALENPGGQEIMKDLGGEKSGLPFYVVLDGKGKKLADSNLMANGTNIGYPGTKEEVSAFESILKRTAAHMTVTERAGVMKHFAEQPPAP